MRKAALMPRIADRDPREVWEKRGALDAYQRAKQRAAEILANPTPVLFPPEIEARIHAAFPEMVRGDVTPLQIGLAND
jgi:trimethylamine--corrinoid protein Co-methyltransferase